MLKQIPYTEREKQIERQARKDAIDEYKKKIELEHKWLLSCKVFDTNVDIAYKTLISYAEQLKEKKE